MRDSELIEFLQWALPRLRLRWTGFRKVRRQVRRRLARRLAALGLDDLEAYRLHLEVEPAEWLVVDRLCRVTISRFFRDRGVWLALENEILPKLVRRAIERGATELRAWCAGCASGEEPYSLAILWRRSLAERFSDLSLRVLATDIDLAVLARARRAVYSPSSLREVGPLGFDDAFQRSTDGSLLLDPSFHDPVWFAALDLKEAAPRGAFDLVFCRNLAFTYYETDLQCRIVETIRSRLEPDGVLVIGSHERLPAGIVHRVLDAHGIIELGGPPPADS